MADDTATHAPAGLFRRLGALLYDALLAIALAFVATFAMLPLTHGEAIVESTQGSLARLYHALVVAIVFAYFGRSWTRTGQTVGLMAWRLRLESDIGGRIGWGTAVARFLLGGGVVLAAVVGLWTLRTADGGPAVAGAAALVLPALANLAWIPFDREGRSLIDRAGRARVVRLR